MTPKLRAQQWERVVSAGGHLAVHGVGDTLLQPELRALEHPQDVRQRRRPPELLLRRGLRLERVQPRQLRGQRPPIGPLLEWQAEGGGVRLAEGRGARSGRGGGGGRAEARAELA